MLRIRPVIDKPYPLASSNPVRAAYVKRYNEEYAKTPATLRELDSLLAVVADDSTRMAAVGQRARTLLWSNSHANGAFIARTILERFGVDSLFPAVANPGAFLRTYAAMEAVRSNPPPFSAKAWRVIERRSSGATGVRIGRTSSRNGAMCGLHGSLFSVDSDAS